MYIFVFFFIKMFLFIHLWLCWISVTAQAFLSLWYEGFSPQWLPLRRGQALGHVAPHLCLLGSRTRAQQSGRTGSAAMRPHGIFPDPGSNPCLLHWQADSLLLTPGKPHLLFFSNSYFIDIQFIHNIGKSWIHEKIKKNTFRKWNNTAWR